MGLACLLSQGTPIDQIDPNAVLTENEKAHLEAVAEDDACLPEAFERHVKETEEKIQKGEISMAEVGSPTRECQ